MRDLEVCLTPHDNYGGVYMIEIKNVVKEYGSGEASSIALNDISLTIPEKQFVTITGKSGSGKTTLLNMLGLIDVPNSGKIIVNGQNISKLKRKEVMNYRRNTVGIVFQFFNLISVLNVRENILIANEYTKKVADD